MSAQTRSMDLTLAITTFVALGIGIFVAIFLSRGISGRDPVRSNPGRGHCGGGLDP